MMVRILQERPRGAALAALRRATATDHHSVDALIDARRLVEIGYYVAALRGLIDAAEAVERSLPLIPQEMYGEGLSPADVSKRVAIDAESSFLDDLAGARPARRPASGESRLVPSSALVPGTMLGLLYVYVGSALGGLHLLRVARTAPWWRHEREHLLLRPYADHLGERWTAVRNALDRLDADGTNAAVLAASAGFDLHHRSLVEQFVIGGVA